MSATERKAVCSKGGCGAQRRIGFPCTDWDCPQSYVIAAEYRLLLAELAALPPPTGEPEDQTIFYEVATLDGVAFAEPSFALVRIDASKRIGSGVEGVIMSRHWTRREADDAAILAATHQAGEER